MYTNTMASRGAYSGTGGIGGNYGPTMGTSRFFQVQRQMMGQDRSHEINMREMQYMAAQQALGLGQGGGANAGMNQWLDQWNQTLQESKGVYNQALQSFEGTYEWMTSAGESASRLGNLAEQMEGEYTRFREDFAGLDENFRLAAQEELEARGVAREQLMQATQADYEGVSGRAMADVSSQGNLARQADARRLQRLGMDPTTTQGRASMDRISGQEATGKAMASTQARRGEKERATGATAMAMQLLDPTRMMQSAMGIRSAGASMLGQSAQMRGQHASTLAGLAGQQTQIAQGQANIAGGMATNIAGQYGDMGGLQMGLQYGAQQNAMNFMGSMPSYGQPASSPFSLT
ncbi:MAG: hypothetical protein JRI94_00410 [Deltaproteobacteria bacterium]|nr:hypothetical protein [Deltaproteobacteria bacterium]